MSLSAPCSTRSVLYCPFARNAKKPERGDRQQRSLTKKKTIESSERRTLFWTALKTDRDVQSTFILSTRCFPFQSYELECARPPMRMTNVSYMGVRTGVLGVPGGRPPRRIVNGALLFESNGPVFQPIFLKRNTIYSKHSVKYKWRFRRWKKLKNTKCSKRLCKKSSRQYKQQLWSTIKIQIVNNRSRLRKTYSPG